jgi:hypothetical protein
MSRSRDIDRILDRWMDNGPTVVADHVIAEAMTEIQTTRQSGARWAPLKEILMTLRPATVVLGLAAVIILGVAAYQLMPDGSPSIGASPSPTAADVSSPSPTAASDLAAIVVTNENAPAGWEVGWTLHGPEALAYLIRYGQVTNATPGFIDARAAEVCASGQGCGIAWVALYDSEADAEAAFTLFHGELQVGWGLGDRAQAVGLGEDEGHAYSNNLGNAAANHAYLWRRGNLLLGVLGLAEVNSVVAELEVDALRSVAEEMNARSR